MSFSEARPEYSPALRCASAAAIAGTICLSFGISAAWGNVVETREFEERVVLDAGDMEVVVENVFGSIRVVGYDGDVVELSGIETITGDRQRDVDRARDEVSLRTEQTDGRLVFRVSRGNGCDCNYGRRWSGYTVAYDLELRVPRTVAFDISTVNRGDIEIEGVHGDFRVSNVNGSVTLSGLRNAGHVETVNGRLTASFDLVPKDSTSFKTVNGEVDVTFPSELSADLRFRTMRGDIRTDFEAEPLAVPPTSEVENAGSTVIRTQRQAAVRVAGGGPTYSFETLNGDITVRESR